jgi:phosphonate transport system substrate-binding protein
MTRVLLACSVLTCSVLGLALGCATVDTPAPERHAATASPVPPFSMGIASYGGAEIARADAQALETFLSEKLGRTVTIRTFSMEWELGTALAEGRLDFAWLPPFAFLDAQAKGDVKPLAQVVRHGLQYYRGVLFSRTDSRVDSAQKLAGSTVAWVAKSSAAGYLFPRAALAQAGFKPTALFKRELFSGDHTAVCRAVLTGEVDVGATFADDRPNGESMQIDGCVQGLGADKARELRIVGTSAPIPNDVIASRVGLWPADVDKLRQLFLKMAESDDGRAILQKVFKAEAFGDVKGDEIDAVRRAAEAAR